MLRKSFIAKQYHQTQEKKPDKNITLVELAGLQQHSSWLWLDEHCDPCWAHRTQSSTKFLLNSLLLLLYFFRTVRFRRNEYVFSCMDNKLKKKVNEQKYIYKWFVIWKLAKILMLGREECAQFDKHTRTHTMHAYPKKAQMKRFYNNGKVWRNIRVCRALSSACHLENYISW